MQLIVLGMHRSGTSSVTRLLNLAGAYFGPEGMATEANDENPKGFWERRDIRAVCDGLLQGAGFDWWKIADFDPGQIPEPVLQENLAAFRRIVLELDAHRPWVVKEPRLSLVVPLLRPTLEAPVFVHVAREPVEIAESLASRNGFPVPVGLALWEAYTAAALAASRSDPRVLVSYGALLRDPVTTTATLLEELAAFGVQRLRMPSEREITAFVSPTLHRHHQPASDRGGYLNAAQAALAGSHDGGRLPDPQDSPLLVSPGAVATLRAFEASRADVEASRADVEAVQADLEASVAERAQVAVAHQELLEDLRTSHQQAQDELRALAAQRAAATQATEQLADELLEVATRRVRAVQASGAVRVGARLSRLRDRLRGHHTSGADAAIEGALSHIERARTALAGDLHRDGAFAAGPEVEEPPPVQEMRRHRAAARAAGDRARVAVLAWDVGHNPFGRAHLLADLLRDRFDVEVWGSQFERYGSDLWPPLRHTDIPVRRFRGSSFPDFLDTLDDCARRLDVDAIYVSKPRLPSLALGILAKEQWNRPLIVDIDDFEPSFFDVAEPLHPDELPRHAQDPDIALPFGRLWTQACDSVVRSADQLTVSNTELEALYGGIVVPHARDERLFDPALHDRSAARRRLGLGDADRLIIFGGTPRAHKGILGLLAALDELNDAHLRVGVFCTRELEELRKEIGSLARWILPLPHHAFDDLPGLLAAADLSCALQSPGHPVSRFQMPAKVTDAMAMGVPCLVTPVPPLMPLVDQDVVEVFDGVVPLPDKLREIFDRADETADRAQRARALFLESYSYAAVRPAVTDAVNRLLADPPPLAPELTTLVTTARRLFRPEAVPAPRVRRPMPPGSTYDLVMFWKQNDTGIYGRRQDMFLKYLERSGRFRTIVHFDQPLSAEALLLAGRRSIRATDQTRLVLEQTLRRLAHRSDRGALRHRTFVYAGGRLSRAVGFPHRNEYPDYVRSVLEREGLGERPLLCWVYPTSSFLPDVMDALGPDLVVADVVDDNRTWYEPGAPMYEKLDQNYAAVLARSDVVLANCQPVAESMLAFVPRVEVVPNACELPETAGSPERPRELDGIRGPIVGYAGNLSDRIDLALLHQLAQTRRDWTLVVLGSAHLDRSAMALADQPNVRLLGTKRYAEAQAIIRHFDVGLIPHLDNKMTRSMNPLKAFVYCALGVPIVSTPVANLDEMSEFITVAEGPDEFVVAIEEALRSGHQRPERAALLPHSWDERVERVLRQVDEAAELRRTADD
ncbi:MAG: glycosyltransferase [Acidimicrobiales bacterium]